MAENHVQEMSLTRQATWILLAKIVSYALVVAVPLLLARQLDQTEFGLYKQVFLVLATANAMIPFSFGMNSYYFLPREKDSQRRAAAVFHILLFNAAVGGLTSLVLALQPQLLTIIFRDEQMAAFAPTLGLAIAFWMFSSFLEMLVIANQEPKLAMRFIIGANFSKAFFFIAAALLFGTVQSLVYAALVQAFLQSVILLIYVNSRFPGFWRCFNASLFREQFFYTLPFGLLAWLYTLQTDLHNYFVSNRYSPAEFAIYSVGCFELPLIAILAESAAAVLIPLMSRLQSTNDRREIVQTSLRVMRKLALCYFPIYVFLMITAEAFITTLFTEKFEASVPIFRLNLTLLPFLVVALDPIVRAYQKLGYFVLRIRIVLFTAMIFALWWATNNAGLLAINAVVIIVSLLERLITTRQVMHTIGWQRGDWRGIVPVLKTALACLLAGAATFAFYALAKNALLPFLHDSAAAFVSVFGLPKLADLISGSLFLALCATIFAPIYLTLTYLSGAIEPSEKQQLIDYLKKLMNRGSQGGEKAVSAET